MFFVLVILLGLGIMMRGRRSINTLLRDLDRGPSRAAAATNAIREAGTNLLPELLRIGFQNDSGMDLFLRSTLKPFLPKYHPPSERFRIEAHTAISILGTNAAYALVERLGQLPFVFSQKLPPSERYEHPVNQAAMALMLDLHTNAVPALIWGLQSSNEILRLNVCYVLSSTPEPQVHKDARVAQSLVEAITPLLDSRSSAELCLAINALGVFDPGPSANDRTVNRVVQLLAHPHSGVRTAAAFYLARAPQQARQAKNFRREIQEALDRENKAADEPPPENPSPVGTQPKKERVFLLNSLLKWMDAPAQ